MEELEILATENAESKVSSDSDKEIILVSEAEALPNKANVPSPEYEPLATEKPVGSKASANPEGPSTVDQIATCNRYHLVIEVDLSSDDKPMPGVRRTGNREEAAPVAAVPFRHGVSRVIFTMIINEGLC